MKQSDHETSLKISLGFSLLELMVVVVLVAGLVAIAIPSLRSLTGANIKNEITKLAGLTSEVYARAAISGITHRINFDLDKQSYWVEEKVGDIGNISPELGYEDIMKERQKQLSEKNKDDAQRFIPEWKALSDDLGEKFILDQNLVFHGAWTEQMSEVARTGIVSIYFFTGGYTQSAFVSISKEGEEEESSLYLSLSPLTGAVEIDVGEPEINSLLDKEKEQ